MTILWLCAAAAVPPLPHPTSVFTAHTIEYDDTLNGTLIVKQTLYRDNDAKRQYMIADGSLAHGHFEETMRCDFKPFGFALEMHGDEGSQPSTWQCQNDTINRSSRTFRQAGTFLTTISPLRAKSTTIKRQGKPLDVVGGERGRAKGSGPSRSARVSYHSRWNTPLRLGKTSVLPQHRWHIDFISFEAAPPPLSAFDPPAGLPACTARKEGPSGRGRSTPRVCVSARDDAIV